MAIPYFTEDVEIIQKLGTNPNTDNNLDEQGLKAQFDEGASRIKRYLNEQLIPSLDGIKDGKVVLYSEQELASDQQAQARKNINALRAPENSQRSLFLSATEGDFETVGSNKIYKRSGKLDWLLTDKSFDFTIRFAISAELGDYKVYELTKADCILMETDNKWRYFRETEEGTVRTTLTIVNGIDFSTGKADDSYSFVYPSNLLNFEIEFYRVQVSKGDVAGVVSVNGVYADQYGNVEIPTDGGNSGGGYSKTVLWQNASPNSKFSSQTIALPLGEYDAVEIVYEYYTYASSNFLGTTGDLPVMEGFSTLATLSGAGNNPATLTITTSGVEVTMSDRETNAPLTIYGIKHGSSGESGEVSYTNVLDSVGYETNKAIMSGDEEDNVGTDLTGYIEVVGGDVIRLKNVTMPDVDGFANRVYCYNWSKSLVNVLSITSSNTANSPVFKNGNLVQFAILEQNIKEYIGDEGWIRIGAANIDTNSIITVNEEIE